MKHGTSYVDKSRVEKVERYIEMGFRFRGEAVFKATPTYDKLMRELVKLKWGDETD